VNFTRGFIALGNARLPQKQRGGIVAEPSRVARVAIKEVFIIYIFAPSAALSFEAGGTKRIVPKCANTDSFTGEEPMSSCVLERSEVNFEVWYQEFKTENAGKSNEDLLGQFWNVFRATAHNYLQMAACLRMIKENGGDLSEPRQRLNGFFVMLERIAYGQMVADVLVRFGGKLNVAQRIATLPIEEQKQILKDGVKLLVYAPNGGRSTMSVDPGELRKEQLSQVFARDHIRSESEQALHLAAWRKRQQEPLPTEMHGWKLDPALGTARKGNVVSTREELKAILKLLGSDKESTT
jgi:hypothetical protein